jgi:hypothetical protein
LHLCDRGCKIKLVRGTRWLLRRPGDQAGSGRLRLSRDARLIAAGQGVRAAGYGFTAVLLGALLADRGFSSIQAGLTLTALIAGTALASLVVGRYGDRMGRRGSYALLFGGITLAGVAVAAGGPWWVLLVVALTGTLSTDVVDNGPATTLEQAMLAAEDAGTAAVYGRWTTAARARACGRRAGVPGGHPARPWAAQLRRRARLAVPGAGPGRHQRHDPGKMPVPGRGSPARRVLAAGAGDPG